jgi:hypothetical protein
MEVLINVFFANKDSVNILSRKLQIRSTLSHYVGERLVLSKVRISPNDEMQEAELMR